MPITPVINNITAPTYRLPIFTVEKLRNSTVINEFNTKRFNTNT
jgi:hypothetical protein